MKKKILQIFSILIVFGATFLFVCSGNGKSSPGFEGYYEYPDYRAMSPLLIISKCRIPEATLEVMTDEQLAQAVADFPLLIDIGAASSYEYGIKCLTKDCDAYKELLTRENAKDALMSTFMKLDEDEEGRLADKFMLAIIFFHEKNFKGTLSEEETEYAAKM